MCIKNILENEADLHMKRCLFVNRKNKLHFIGKISFLLNNNYVCAVIVVCETRVCTCYIHVRNIHIRVVLHPFYIPQTYNSFSNILLYCFNLLRACNKHAYVIKKKVLKDGSLPKKWRQDPFLFEVKEFTPPIQIHSPRPKI